MISPPDLSTLTPAQKDALILELIARLNHLEALLAKHSHNSSKPPSTDGDARKTKSLRKTKPGAVGGQPGHPGYTLKRVAHPDHVVVHPVASQCQRCGADLVPDACTLLPETRQVVDLPPMRPIVTEHRVQHTVCRCGQIHTGAFPTTVTQPVQYGPQARAAMVYLTHYQHVPMDRTAQAMADLFHLPVSTATVQHAIDHAAQVLAPLRETIGAALQAAPVVHADDTSVHVGRHRQWLHSASSANLTWYGAHPQRDRVALDALGILPQFTGVLVHDGWRPYASYACDHALCNAHHLRELVFIVETTQQTWAQQMMDLLLQAKAEVEACGAAGQSGLSLVRVTHYRQQAAALVAAGQQQNPKQVRQRIETRGRIKQSLACNLLRRLHEQADQVWRFLGGGVPFDNNQAERDLRMPKLKQKISGCWRTAAGLDAYCVIRSYLATLRKQGRALLDALTCAFDGHPPSPLPAE